MNYNWRKFIYLTLLVPTAACGPIKLGGSGNGEPPQKVLQLYSLNGTKLISPNENNPRSPNSFRQATYMLSSSNRLLLRFENMMDYAGYLGSDGASKVQVLITPTSASELQAGLSSLKLCPIVRNWSMYATWQKAHPFGSAGVWQTPGGDLDQSGCVQSTASDSSDNPQSLVFDINPWVKIYLKARGTNFGYVLIASAPVQIYGDTSGAFFPRVQWLQ